MQGEVHFRYGSPWLAVFVVAWLGALLALFPDPLGMIAKGWLLVPVGFAGAVLGNISAVGGGIVFIPVMIFAFDLAPVDALKIALASQAFGMTSGAIAWMQKGVVPLGALRLTVPGLLVGSTLSSLVIQPSALLIKLLFGPVSIALGVLTLVLARRPATVEGGREIPARARIPLVAASFVGGLLTGWIAIGEGEIVAALLMLAYGVPVATCIGLGVLLLSINSIFLTGLHVAFLGGVPWEIAMFTGFGCVFGARLAPWLSRHANPIALKTIFAVIAIGDGLLFVAQFVADRFAR